VGAAGSGSGRGVHERSEGFPRGKKRDLFGGYLDHGTRFRIAAGTRLTGAEPKAPKAPQFDFVSGLEGLRDALEKQVHDDVGLSLRELETHCDHINELRFGHTHTSPVREGYHSQLDHAIQRVSR
jgi:hypothetical protein